MATRLLLVSTLALSFNLPATDAAPPNYDETKVPKYELPNPLVMLNGEQVTDAETWVSKRRPEILRLFQTQVYGKTPPAPVEMSFQVTSTDKDALGGKATRKEVSIHFTANKKGPRMDLLLYLPNDASVRFLPSWDSISVAIIPFTLTRILR